MGKTWTNSLCINRNIWHIWQPHRITSPLSCHILLLRMHDLVFILGEGMHRMGGGGEGFYWQAGVQDTDT